MEIKILIAAINAMEGERIKHELKRLAFATNYESFAVYINENSGVSEKMGKDLFRQFHMAFVSLERQDALLTGELLYTQNRACPLIYYGRSESKIFSVLPTRPVWYWNVGKQPLKEVFMHQLDQLRKSPYYFSFSDRQCAYLLTYEEIGCFYSLKRALYLHTVSRGELGTLHVTLDKLEQELPVGKFLRVHQSFLVNKRHIFRLDRATHILMLHDGYEVPVSRAMYQNVCAYFDQNSRFASQNDVTAGFAEKELLYSSYKGKAAQK